jgi:endo-1,3-1,4-beta-glycanase ExoK
VREIAARAIARPTGGRLLLVMLVMYNVWLTGEVFASGQSGILRTWAEDVDWLYHAKDTYMTLAEVMNAVSYYRSRGIEKIDTMPPPILPPPM